MATNIDERVVEMKFDNAQFEKGVKQSMKTLKSLDETIDHMDKNTNLDEMSKNLNKLRFDKLEDSVTSLNKRFSAFGVAGMTVIQDLTHAAENLFHTFGNWLKKPLAIAKSGGWARALNIEDAKFQLKGLGVAWEEVSDDIDYAVSGTAFGLDAAAKAASQLVASGVELGDSMKGALRGISGVAAMTNSTYEEISPIFTTIAGQGKVMTMQLRQLESRGLNAAASLAKVYGVSEAELRDMVTHGLVDFDTFARAMDEAFGEHAKDANATFTGALGNMQFALKKIGAKIAEEIQHDFIPVFNDVRLWINDIATKIQPSLEKINKWIKLASYYIRDIIGQINRSDVVSNFINKVVDLLHEAINTGLEIYDLVGPLFDTLKRATGELIEALGSILRQMLGINKEIPAIEVVIKGLEVVIAAIVSGVTMLVKGVTALLNMLSHNPVISGIINKLKPFAGVILPAIVAALILSKLHLLGIVAIVGAIAAAVTAIISLDIPGKVVKLTNAVIAFFTTLSQEYPILTDIKNFFIAMYESIKNFIAGVGAFLSSLTKFDVTLKKTEKEVKKTGNAFTDFFDSISEGFASIGAWFETTFEPVLSFLNNFAKELRFTDLAILGITATFSAAALTIAKVMKVIGNTVFSLTGFINSLKTAINRLSLGFQTLFANVGRGYFLYGLAAAFFGLAAAVASVTGAMYVFTNIITDKNQMWMSLLYLTLIVTAFTAAIVIASNALKKMYEAGNTFSKFSTEFTSSSRKFAVGAEISTIAMEDLAKGFKNFAKAAKFGAIAVAIKAAAVAIATIAGAIAVLAGNDVIASRALTAAQSISLVLVALGGMFALISFSNKRMNIGTILGFTLILTAMSGMMLVLANAVSMMSTVTSIPWAGIISSVITMIIGITAIAVAMQVAGDPLRAFADILKESGVAIVAIVAALILLPAALDSMGTAVAKISLGISNLTEWWQGLISALDTLTIVLGATAGAALVIVASKLASNIIKTGTLLAEIIFYLTNFLNLLADIGSNEEKMNAIITAWNHMVEGIASMFFIAAGLMVASHFADNAVKVAAMFVSIPIMVGGVIAALHSLWELAEEVYNKGQIHWQSILIALSGLALVIAAIIVLTKQAGTLEFAMKISSLAALAGAIAMVTFAVSLLTIVGRDNPEALVAAGLSVVGSLIAVAKIIEAFGLNVDLKNILKAELGLFLVSIILGLLASAFAWIGTWSTGSVESLVTIIASTASVILLLSLALGILSKVVSSVDVGMLFAVAGAFTVMSIGVTLMAVAIGILAQSVRGFNSLDTEALKVALIGLNAIILQLNLAVGILSIVLSSIAPLADVAVPILAAVALVFIAAGAAMALITAAIGYFIDAVGHVVDAIAKLFVTVAHDGPEIRQGFHEVAMGIVDFFYTLGKYSPLIENGITKLLTILAKALVKILDIFGTFVSSLAVKIVVGGTTLAAAIVLAGDAIALSIGDAINKIKLKIIEGLTTMPDIGEWISKGLGQGLKDGSDELKKDATDLAKFAIEKPIRDETTVHSPPPKYIQIGKYVAKGLAEGMLTEKTTTAAAARRVAKTIEKNIVPEKEVVEGKLTLLTGEVFEPIEKGAEDASKNAEVSLESIWENVKKKWDSGDQAGAIMEIFSGLGDLAGGAFEDMFGGWMGDITSDFNTMIDGMMNSINGVEDAAKHLHTLTGQQESGIYLTARNKVLKSDWADEHGLKDVDLARDNRYDKYTSPMERYLNKQVAINAKTKEVTDEQLKIIEDTNNTLDRDLAIRRAIYGDYESDKLKASDAYYGSNDELPTNTGNLQDNGEAAGEAASYHQQLLETITSSIDVFNEFDDTVEKTSKDLFKALDSQQKKVEDWAHGIEILAKRGFSKDIVQTLIDTGVDNSYEIVSAMLTMNTSEIKRYNKGFENTAKISENTWEILKKYFDDEGNAIGEAFAKGANDSIEKEFMLGDRLPSMKKLKQTFKENFKNIKMKDIIKASGLEYMDEALDKFIKTGTESKKKSTQEYKEVIMNMFRDTLSQEELNEFNKLLTGTEKQQEKAAKMVGQWWGEVNQATEDGVRKQIRSMDTLKDQYKTTGEELKKLWKQQNRDAREEFADRTWLSSILDTMDSAQNAFAQYIRNDATTEEVLALVEGYTTAMSEGGVKAADAWLLSMSRTWKSKNVEEFISSNMEAYAIALENNDLDKIAELGATLEKYVTKLPTTAEKFETVVNGIKDGLGELMHSDKQFSRMTKNITKAFRGMTSVLNTGGLEIGEYAIRQYALSLLDMEEIMEEAKVFGVDTEEVISTHLEEITNTVLDFRDSIASSLESAIVTFEKFDEGEEITFQTLEENLRNNITKLNEWRANIRKLQAKGYSQQVIEAMTSEGIGSYAKVAALVSEDATNIGVDAINQMYGQLKENAETGADEAVGAVMISASTVGTDTMDKVEEVIDEKFQNMKPEITDVVSDSLGGAISDGLENAKIPETCEEAANLAATTLANTVDNHENRLKVRDAAQHLGERIGTGIRKAIKADRADDSESGTKAKIESYGRFLMNGLVHGINDNKQKVIDAVKSVCQEAIETAREEFDINSPSRVTQWMGYMIDMGFAKGIDENTYYVEDSVENLTKQMIEYMAKVHDEIDDYVNDDDYVIKPVLDLDNLQNARSLIAKEFAGDNTIALRSTQLAGQTTSNSQFMQLMDMLNGYKGNTSTVNYGDTTIIVNAPEGTDENQIAEMVMEKMQQRVDRRKYV